MLRKANSTDDKFLSKSLWRSAQSRLTIFLSVRLKRLTIPLHKVLYGVFVSCRKENRRLVSAISSEVHCKVAAHISKHLIRSPDSKNESKKISIRSYTCLRHRPRVPWSKVYKGEDVPVHLVRCWLKRTKQIYCNTLKMFNSFRHLTQRYFHSRTFGVVLWQMLHD